MSDRREFLKNSTSAAALWSLRRSLPAETLRAMETMADPPAVKALLETVLNAAKVAGANYADVRIQQLQRQSLATRERQVLRIDDSLTIGCGVRALVDGTWGFAATRDLTADGVRAAAQQAVATAKASRPARGKPVELAPTDAHPDATWTSAFETDPWNIPVEQKVDLLLRANAQALTVKGVGFVNSGFFAAKEQRNFASTDGSFITQTVVRCQPTMQVTAIAPDRTDFQALNSLVPPMGRGWEYVEQQDIVGHAAELGENAVAKLSAKSVDIGRYDLVLHPTNLWLTIHESIAHPTELDRALGYEANFAGTSFVAPPQKMLGRFRYGPDFMNIQGDRSQAGGLSTIGYDDEGVAPDEFLIIKNGIVNEYQTTREQANWLSWWYKQEGRAIRSHGCSYAQDWSHVQFQRMPNVSLRPGPEGHTWDDLVGATDRGIAIKGNGSFSIDQQRYNAQFGGQLFYEIKGGKIAGMLRDVAYQIRTPDFWNSLSMIGGQQSYELNGAFNDGKGQPEQVNAVSHGSVPARFVGVTVINTGRKA